MVKSTWYVKRHINAPDYYVVKYKDDHGYVTNIIVDKHLSYNEAKNLLEKEIERENT